MSVLKNRAQCSTKANLKLDTEYLCSNNDNSYQNSQRQK